MTTLRKLSLGLTALAAVLAWKGASLRTISGFFASSSPVSPPQMAAPRTEMVAPLSWEERWQQWLVRLAASGRDVELVSEFEALVVADPQRALTYAQREDEPRRTCLIQTIFVLWSESDLGSAIAQARTLPDTQRATAVAVVLAGMADRPEDAVKLGTEFCRRDPALALEHGYALIATLGRVSDFRRAVRFAAEARDLVTDEERTKWLKAAFAQWSAENPASALAAIQELPESGARFEALEAIAAQRVRSDPAGLVATLRQLPAGADRSVILAQALRGWVRQDPKTAAEWIDRLEPSSELDAGAAAVAGATQNQLDDRSPKVALSWASSIVAPELRSRTVTSVVQTWATTDPTAARRYAEESTDLLPEDRAALVENFALSPSERLNR